MPIIDTSGVKVAYMEGGAGEPVLALHSSAGTGRQWKALHQDTKDQFYLLAPDLCGYGDSSPWQGNGPLSLHEEGNRVATIMDRLIEPVHLVGHSYGGAVALRLAMDKPHRVRSLTLIEPAAFNLLRGTGDANKKLFAEISGVAGAVSDCVVSGNYEKGISRFIDYWSGPGTWSRLSDEKKSELRCLATKISLDFWASCTEQTRLEDYRQLRIPTLVLNGENSPAPARRISEMLAVAMPFAKMHTIDNAGHMLPVTHPGPVNQHILRHLQGNLTRYRRAA